MPKRLILSALGLCACFLMALSTIAQHYYYNEKYYSHDVVFEFGGSFGVMNSLTDLGGTKGIGKKFIKDLNLQVTKPSYSVYGIGMYRDFIGVRLEGTFGRIESYDSILKKKDPDLIGRYGRNLSFRSKITDVQLAIEVHPLFFKYHPENESPYWSPYIVAGIGYFSFNPQASLNGKWYDLYPLHLEGQGFAEYPDRKPYKLRQFNIPLGAGIKYELNSFINARLELVYRVLFTDYLDDVSTGYIDPALFVKYLQRPQAAIAQRLYSRMQELQPGYIVKNGQERGDPKDNDAFFTIQLKFGFTLRADRR